MKEFKKYINGTYEDEIALVEITEVREKVIMYGDYYHDKIYEKIEGFFRGLEYCGVEYKEKNKSEEIFPDNPMFSAIGFCNGGD